MTAILTDLFIALFYRNKNVPGVSEFAIEGVRADFAEILVCFVVLNANSI